MKEINAALQEISDYLELGIKLTTYVSRHTYATVLKKSGVSVAKISESLGHNDIQTTEIYLDSFEKEELDEADENLL